MTSTSNLKLIPALVSIIGLGIASTACTAPHADSGRHASERAAQPAPEAGDRDTPAAVTLALLRDQTTWANAAAPDRRHTAQRVAATLPGFSFRSMETIETSGAPLELAILAHAQTGLDFVLIPAGSFWMGSPQDEPGRATTETRHRVTISQPFLMSRTEVTQTVWKRIMNSNPTRYDRAASKPVTHVSWNDAVAFCERTGLELPTEAQWEYACRAGTDTRFSSGADESSLDAVAWYEANSGAHLQPVGLKLPNPFGLLDMHGNALEWCRDGVEPFGPESVTDPVLGRGSTQRIRRGGSWKQPPVRQRSAARDRVGPSSRSHHCSFRPIRIVNTD